MAKARDIVDALVFTGDPEFVRDFLARSPSLLNMDFVSGLTMLQQAVTASDPRVRERMVTFLVRDMGADINAKTDDIIPTATFRAAAQCSKDDFSILDLLDSLGADWEIRNDHDQASEDATLHDDIKAYIQNLRINAQLRKGLSVRTFLDADNKPTPFFKDSIKHGFIAQLFSAERLREFGYENAIALYDQIEAQYLGEDKEKFVALTPLFHKDNPSGNPDSRIARLEKAYVQSTLIRAAENADLDGVKEALANGADVNVEAFSATGERLHTNALRAALRAPKDYKKSDAINAVCLYLLEQGANVMESAHQQMGTLELAVLHGRKEIAKAIAEKMKAECEKNQVPFSALDALLHKILTEKPKASENNYERVYRIRLALELGANPNYQNGSNGSTWFDLVFDSQSVNLFELSELVKAGVMPNLVQLKTMICDETYKDIIPKLLEKNTIDVNSLNICLWELGDRKARLKPIPNPATTARNIRLLHKAGAMPNYVHNRCTPIAEFSKTANNDDLPVLSAFYEIGTNLEHYTWDSTSDEAQRLIKKTVVANLKKHIFEKEQNPYAPNQENINPHVIRDAAHLGVLEHVMTKEYFAGDMAKMIDFYATHETGYADWVTDVNKASTHKTAFKAALQNALTHHFKDERFKRPADRIAEYERIAQATTQQRSSLLLESMVDLTECRREIHASKSVDNSGLTKFLKRPGEPPTRA